MKNVGVGYMEVERCRERMAEVEKDDECVTSHPGFESVCLKPQRTRSLLYLFMFQLPFYFFVVSNDIDLQ